MNNSGYPELNQEMKQSVQAALEEVIENAGDRITITYGKEIYSPVSYNTYEVGPFSIETTVRQGETYEQAFERGYNQLIAIAARAFEHKRKQFAANQKMK